MKTSGSLHQDERSFFQGEPFSAKNEDYFRYYTLIIVNKTKTKSLFKPCSTKAKVKSLFKR